jgi:hypothetical protein
MKNEKFESNNIIEDLLNKKNELLTASENLLNELQEIHDNVGKIKEYFLNHIDTNQNSIHEIQKINHSIKNITNDLNKIKIEIKSFE